MHGRNYSCCLHFGTINPLSFFLFDHPQRCPLILPPCDMDTNLVPSSFSVICTIVIFLSPLVFAKDPAATNGCTQQPYTYKIQKPYDVPVDQRYSFTEGVHRFWVYSDDKSFRPDSSTKPRSELRVEVRCTTVSCVSSTRPLVFRIVDLCRVACFCRNRHPRRAMTTRAGCGNSKVTCMFRWECLGRA